MKEIKKLGFCGVDCSACPDYLDGKCPDCRRTIWEEGCACTPVECCKKKKIDCCGQCVVFPCEMMLSFYEESDSHREALTRMKKLRALRFFTLRERPELKEKAAAWFSGKWGVPEEAYLECMEAYLSGETEYGWYLCLDGGEIVGGLGVIENDFHDRKDLFPNVCAVYTEEAYRGRGVAGRLLDLAVEDQPSRWRISARTASARSISSRTTRAFTSATAGSSSASRRATARTTRRGCISTDRRKP